MHLGRPIWPFSFWSDENPRWSPTWLFVTTKFIIVTVIIYARALFSVSQIIWDQDWVRPASNLDAHDAFRANVMVLI